MPLSRKKYSLRNKVFYGFLAISILSVVSVSLLSFIIMKNNAEEQSKTDLQSKTNSLMASLDYAVSRTSITTKDIPNVLQNKILEIADINKHDIVIYDLMGNFLISNKEPHLISQKKIQSQLLSKILKQDNRVDIKEYDTNFGTNKTSSYTILKNNFLEPIGIVYLPYYHNDEAYIGVINRYVPYMILINVFIIFFAGFISWGISKNITKAVSQFSEKITKISLLDDEIKPLKLYENDELRAIGEAYNKMILKIMEQKERLAFSEKEKAWREMAKQVAHEVKNPLTPMKLMIQNFERKFDVSDPEITVKTKKMIKTITDQIDLISSVASAFSQFAQLPEKNNEVFELNSEIEGILRIFNNEPIYIHSNKQEIFIKMDKIYLSRIITNLVTNAKQALEDIENPLINVDIEQINKRIYITVEDNGIGIPKEKFKQIFEPNFTSKNSGMGLGLTMVKKMVEDYNGEISVQSEVGKGAKFTISMPNNL